MDPAAIFLFVVEGIGIVVVFRYIWNEYRSFHHYVRLVNSGDLGE